MQASGQFESDFRYRQRLAGPEKQRIAAAAAALVEPGQTVIVDDSSTAGGMAKHLAENRPLTVITNNLAVIQELAGATGITLIALGGQYSKKFHGFFGLVADEALRSLRADIAFVSTSSIHGTRAFHQDQEVVQTKRLMLAAAERKYLLVDHGKFGRPALHFLNALDSFDAVLTGDKPDAAVGKALHEAGIRLTVIGKD
jgi:DeoR/GlpR family transcriptional regulator of sugar metabolism